MNLGELCDTQCPPSPCFKKQIKQLSYFSNALLIFPSSVPGTLPDFRNEVYFSFTANQYY